MDFIEWQDLGIMPYRGAWGLQESLRSRRMEGAIGDRVLLVEHPPVFTLGRRECPEDIVSTEDEIAADGIELVRTNRGGRVTYHGPGQLVCYFICALAGFGMGVADFVRAIEATCIGLLGDFRIRAARDPERPGLWVGPDKIVAIGLNVSRGVTQHGLALNARPDLTAYRHIVPCGIRGRGVTTMERVLGKAPEMAALKASLLAWVGRSFNRRLSEISG